MQSTREALEEGFKKKNYGYSFQFGDNDEYELTFEQLLFDGQMYVAVYKNGSLLTNKVVVKPGYVKQEDIL